ncbi:hypothetical protein CABS01_06116 [Colletotrichum abscissum]|uniref:uncharacterized protein n=1 Tax=Colletotrichum abscissum TaxID=1671311 RepID=UPI0027D5FE7F|nr:uncharacterized protein CABS01_06116 [Colletotrichum abscissum]KAK1518582.1 hypothetical protein CABS01_06116 [Colletotrichum abscissum]
MEEEGLSSGQQRSSPQDWCPDVPDWQTPKSTSRVRVVIFRSHGPQQSVFCPIGGHHAPGDENGAPVNGQVCPNKGTKAGKGVIEVAVRCINPIGLTSHPWSQATCRSVGRRDEISLHQHFYPRACKGSWEVEQCETVMLTSDQEETWASAWAEVVAEKAFG